MTNIQAQPIHKPPYSYKEGSARLVRLIAFDKIGRILVVQKGNAIDIIKGRQEFDDDTHEDAVRREAEEQASVSLGEVSLAAKIQLPEWINGKPVYELVFTGLVDEIGLRPDGNDYIRFFMDKKVFIKKYRQDSTEEMKALIEMADLYCLKEQNYQRHTEEFRLAVF